MRLNVFLKFPSYIVRSLTANERGIRMEGIIPAFRDSLWGPGSDLIKECGELVLDELLENEAIKGIPVVSIISNACKAIYSLQERHFIKQTLSFIESFNAGTADPDKITKYVQKLQNNPKKQEEELGRVLILLDRQIEEMQAKILARFYFAYVMENISWEKFCELSEANRRMFVSDYAVLRTAYDSHGINLISTDQSILYQIDRLVSLGLLENTNRMGGIQILSFDDAVSPEEEKHITITSFGQIFCQYMSDI